MSPDTMIEVIDLVESGKSKEINPHNFKESQRLALQGYNYRQKYDQ